MALRILPHLDILCTSVMKRYCVNNNNAPSTYHLSSRTSEFMELPLSTADFSLVNVLLWMALQQKEILLMNVDRLKCVLVDNPVRKKQGDRPIMLKQRRWCVLCSHVEVLLPTNVHHQRCFLIVKELCIIIEHHTYSNWHFSVIFELMQRMFKYGDISLTPDKELNILMHGTPFYVIVYRSHTLLNVVRFCPPCTYFIYMLAAD